MTGPKELDTPTLDGLEPGADNGTAKTMSLMGGVVRPEGLPEAEGDLDLDGARPGARGVSQGTILMVVIVVVTAGTLFGMRLTQTGGGGDARAREVQARVESALARLSNPESMADEDPLSRANLDSLFRDTDEIVAMFSADLTENQVPIKYVKKNPFMLPVYRAAVLEAGPEQAEGAGSSLAADRLRLQELMKEVKRLELQSVVQGKRPVAVINGALYQPGQRIGSMRVKAIHQMRVDLEGGGRIFTIEIKRSGPGRGRRRR